MLKNNTNLVNISGKRYVITLVMSGVNLKCQNGPTSVVENVVTSMFLKLTNHFVMNVATAASNKSAANNNSQSWLTKTYARRNKSQSTKHKLSRRIAKPKFQLNVTTTKSINAVKIKKSTVVELIKNNTNVELKASSFKMVSNGKTSSFATNTNMNNVDKKKDNSSLTMKKATHMNVNNKNNTHVKMNLKPEKSVSTRMSGPVTQ